MRCHGFLTYHGGIQNLGLRELKVRVPTHFLFSWASNQIFAHKIIPFWEKKGQTLPYLQKVCFLCIREISEFAYLHINFRRLTVPSEISLRESCFFRSENSSSVSYVYTLYSGVFNISLLEDQLRLRAQKHKPTMAFAASPRADDPKMVESPASMAHVSSSYACAEDG